VARAEGAAAAAETDCVAGAEKAWGTAVEVDSTPFPQQAPRCLPLARAARVAGAEAADAVAAVEAVVVAEEWVEERATAADSVADLEAGS